MLWVVYGVLMGHGAEGGAEWIRGREGGRGLGRRVDRIDCIDRIDPMDGMDGMDSGVGAIRRVALGIRCPAGTRVGGGGGK